MPAQQTLSYTTSRSDTDCPLTWAGGRKSPQLDTSYPEGRASSCRNKDPCKSQPRSAPPPPSPALSSISSPEGEMQRLRCFHLPSAVCRPIALSSLHEA